MSEVPKRVPMPRLREAIEASWGQDTAYLEAYEEGNPAFGNCYPTSRVKQIFYPGMQLVKGHVQTPDGNTGGHYWNLHAHDGVQYHSDWTWQQFPHGSTVLDYEVVDLSTLTEEQTTRARIATLLARTIHHLGDKITT